jgi:3'-phosphoadenosine 5'-phosphosulfate sulfotransferase (PAPS reductase)/FAD synthetase
VTDFEFLLSDRLQKIKSMNELYDLEHKAYISFSGGKDSTVLSALVDLALPDNKIPRVYINTGIDYRAIVDFVKEYGKRDGRLEIIQPSQNIRTMLETDGYPFKSKEHSQKVALYQHSGETKTIINYLGKGSKKTFLCPEKLKYNFTDSFKLKISDKCCFRLKKEPAQKWSNENSRFITITGIRQDEGGLRQSVKSCAVFYDHNCKELHKFHPLLVVSDDWINEFIKVYKVELCKLYYPPYNFKRTGCCGCPFNVELQRQLDVLSVLLPAEKRRAEYLWKPVYFEYRKIGYRLRPLDLFDL